MTFFWKFSSFLESSQPTFVYGALLPTHIYRKTPTSGHNSLNRHSTTSMQITENSNAEGKTKDSPVLSTMCVMCLCLTWCQLKCRHPICTLCWVLSRGIIQCCRMTATLLIKKSAWHWLQNYTVISRTVVPLGITSTSKSTEKDKQQKQEYESQLVLIKELKAERVVLERKAEL